MKGNFFSSLFDLFKALVKGLWLFVCVVIVLIIIALIYWHHEQKFPSTQDAVLFSHVTPISPRTSGNIINVAVKPDQFVNKGQLLFAIDDRQATLAVENAKTNLSIAEQNLVQEKANLLVAKQNMNKLFSALTLQQTQYRRLTKLLTENAISVSKVDQTKQALIAAKAQYEMGLANLKIAQAKVGKPGKNTQVEKAKLALQQAELNLSYCKITAPERGYLTNLNLAIGQTVQANKVLFGINPVSQWYIHANILEPFLKNVKVGQPVSFHTIINPEKTYTGYVSGIGRGINIVGWQAQQALPVDPATFQWITVAKRFPIIITVTSNDPQFRFGASASLTINTTKMKTPHA